LVVKTLDLYPDPDSYPDSLEMLDPDSMIPYNTDKKVLSYSSVNKNRWVLYVHKFNAIFLSVDTLCRFN
jgi:hypothetical protein